MACATLKRSLEFDPVHSHGRPSKRQRCQPMCVSPTSSPKSEPITPPSAFAEVCPKLTPEMMAATIREEVQRLQRRRQLNGLSHDTDGSSEALESLSSTSSLLSPSTMDKPLFTFRQVGIICERMLHEREVQIREEYDRALNYKLSEQYEAFVKFTNDQLQKQFQANTAPSYLS